MLYDNGVNLNNSTIKNAIDAWYRNKLLSYASYLDDVIYCNGRRQSNADKNGWNPIGGSVTKYMYFSTHFVCDYETDRFSVSNNKAKLDYAIGLISFDEIDLLDNLTSMATGKKYWTMSPNGMYYDYGGVWSVNEDGTMSESGISQLIGLRPAISLVKDTEYSSGDGSTNNPYVVSVS